MELRRRLLADFGKDLPIAGGIGQSQHDPIVLTTTDCSSASATIVDVVKCIYGALGWYWQIVQWDVQPDLDRIEKVSVTVKYALETDVVTERRNLYFDVSHVRGRSLGAQALPTVELPLTPKVKVPLQIGWFHFDDLIDNRCVDPRLGLSLAYSAPQAKMTIYAYESANGQGAGFDAGQDIRHEYQKAIADFESFNPDAEPLREYTHGSAIFKAYDVDEAFSIVLVAPLGPLFLKLRLTLETGDEGFMVDCAWATVVTFIKLVSR